MSTYVITANNIQELGGAQKIAHTLAQGFADRGHTVHLVGITPVVDPHDYAVSGDYHIHTLMPEVWPMKDTEQAGQRTQLRSGAVEQLRSLLDSCQSANVIATQLWSLEILLDARPWNAWQFPVVGQYHGSFAAAATGRDLRRIQKIGGECDYFAALTVEDAEAFAEAGLTNSIAQPNPLSLTTAQLQSVNRANRGTTIDFIGRLSAEKGPDLLIEAWQLAQQHLPKSWELHFTGDGPMRIELESRGVERVVFNAPVTNVAPVIAGSGVVVLSSRTEGAPLVLAEALALRTPVVATDVSSGVREMMLESTTGILVERDSPAALAEGILLAVNMQPTSAVLEPNDSLIFDRWERLFTDVN
jgi:glycosyltransferase involved in cell wall biosynthesis